jgi:hypothetical protein
MSSIIDIPQNNILELRERIVIEIRYYDELNNLIPPFTQANNIDITLNNSVYLLAEDSYSDNEPYGEGTKSEILIDEESENKYVHKITIEKGNYDKLSTILLQQLKTDAKNISLRVESPSTFIIAEEIIKYILSNFETIYFYFQGMSQWITLPEISVRIKNLTIESAQLYMTQTIISCSSSFIMRECTLQSKPDIKNTPSLLVSVGEEAIFNNIRIADRVNIGVSAKEVKNHEDWANTQVTISDYSIGFKDIFKNDKITNGMYNALLTIADVNAVNISGITSFNDIPYYPIISIKNVNTVNLSSIIRKCNEISAVAPAIRLSNYMECNIYDIQYKGINDSLENSSFIQFIKVRLDSSLSISNAEISKIALLNLLGVKCQKLAISSSKLIAHKVFLKVDSNYISKFVLDDVLIKAESFELTAVSLNIDSSTKIESIEDINITIQERANIHNSVLISRNSINIIVKNAKLNLNTITLEAIKAITIKSDDNESELTSNLLFLSVIVLAHDINFEVFNLINLNTLQFDRINNIVIDSCNGCILKDMLIHLKAETPINFDILKSNIRLSNINIFNPGRYQKLNLSSCTGTLHIAYLDDKNSSEFKTKLLDSDVSISFDAVSNRKITFESSNSLGSLIYSESDTISIIPELESADRQYFERIKDKKKNKKKILYGNII